MGQVWLAERAGRVGWAAVKVLDREAADNPDLVAGLQNEIRAMAALDHPNIVRIYDHGRVPAGVDHEELAVGSPWLAMEYAGEGTLSSERHRLDWNRLSVVIDQMLQALAHAHARGVIHRDIKPANVLFGGERQGAKLTDFGMVYNTDRAREYVPEGGTPQYMAPEQFVVGGNIGPWTDLYALAAVTWRLVAGKRPFEGTSWEQLAAAHSHAPLPEFEPRFRVPAGLELWLRKALQKEPERRFAFAADARLALERATGRVPTAPPGAGKPSDPGLGLFGLRSVPFVGRRAERNLLWGSLREALRSGHAEVGLITGPTGVGKSRLASWLATRAHELGRAHTVRVALRHEMGHASMSAQLLSGLYGCSNLSEADARARLAREVDAEHEGEIVALMRVMYPTSAALPAPSGDQRHAMLQRHMAAVAGERALVVVIDDAHRSSEALGLANFLLSAREARPTPALLVLTAQDEHLAEASAVLRDGFEALSKADGVTAVQLGPLEPVERGELIRGLLALEPELAGQVEERSAGNPLFAVELIKDWVGRDLLELSEQGYRLKRDVETRLPDDLREVWEARVIGLLGGRTTDEVVALELASALGETVLDDEWGAACSLAGVEAPRDLMGSLIERGLVLPTEGGWRFAHPILREAIIELARSAGRWAQVNEVAAALRREQPSPEALGLVGRHLLEAGRTEEALHPLLAGAVRCQQAGIYAQAERLLVEREHALDTLGDKAEAVQRIQGWVLRSTLYRGQGRREEASDFANRAVELLERVRDQDPALRASAVRAQAMCVWDAGDLAHARELLTDAVDRATRSTDQRVLADCASSLGLLSVGQGDLKAGRHALRVVRRMCRTLGDAHGEIRATLGLAYAYIQEEGRSEEALRHLRRVRVMAREAGAREDLAQCAELFGELLRSQGQPERAERYYREAHRLYELVGSRQLVDAQLNLSLCLTAMGRYDEARRVCQGLLKSSFPHAPPVIQAAAHLTLMACRHPDDPFMRHYRTARKLLRQTGSVAVDLAKTAHLAGDRALQAKDPEQADFAWRIALSQYEALSRTRDAEFTQQLLDDLEL
jgi:eukaryotic-like serine/threonine-protein kinase